MTTILKAEDSEKPAVVIVAEGPADGLFIELHAEAAPDSGGVRRGRIMFMPAGTHEVSCFGADDKPAKPITVQVDPTTATRIQASFERLKASSPRRPFFDFNHEEKEAAAWPESFSWSDKPAPGVYAAVEWSQAGADAVEGRTYRGFSPVFLADRSRNPSPIAGVPALLSLGTLTNKPAFKQILPLWAKDSAASAAANTNPGAGTASPLPSPNPMKEQENAAAQAAENKQGTQDAALLKAADSNNETLKAKDAEIISLKKLLADQRKKDAEAAVAAAVAAGRIAPKNEVLKAQWVKLIEADPENAVLLASQPESRITQPVIPPGKSSQPSGVQVTREDTLVVLKAYDADGIGARERGLIYRREISKRIINREDLDLLRAQEEVFKAANTTGTLVGSLVTQRTLELLKEQFPVLTRIARDYSDQPAKLNQTVYARTISIPTPDTWSSVTGYGTGTALTATDVSVTINTHKAVTQAWTVEDLAGTARRLFDEFAPAAAYAIGYDLVTALYALFTAANFTGAPTKCALADINRMTLAAMARDLNKRGVPKMNRIVLLNPDAHMQLTGDVQVVSPFYAGAGVNTVQSGVLPPIAGMDVFEAVSLLTTGNLLGMALFPSAVWVCTRVPGDYLNVLPGAANGVSQVITEPDSGISLQQVQFVDNKLGLQAFQRLGYMYGVAKGDINMGQRLVSA